MNYVDEVIRAMKYCAEDPRVLFLGQSIRYPGNSIYRSLKDIPDDRKIELPVIEEFQMGLSIGLALAGFIPITTYPRFDFLVLAANQLVNHLDKFQELTQGQVHLRIIIRTMVGSKYPLDAGPQHTQNHTGAFRALCPNMRVIELIDPRVVFDEYKKAFIRPDPKPTLFVEHGDFYSLT